MTTIAWDGSTLASDSQSTSNDVICTLNEQKIFTPTEKQWSVNGEVVLAVGTAGDCGIELQLFEMMEAGLTHKSQFTPEPSFTALAVTGKGRMWIISKNTGDAHASIKPATGRVRHWLRRHDSSCSNALWKGCNRSRRGRDTVRRFQWWQDSVLHS